MTGWPGDGVGGDYLIFSLDFFFNLLYHYKMVDVKLVNPQKEIIL